MKYYIASPGFNEAQLNRIKEIESILDSKNKNYYSPFKHGGTLGLVEDKELSKVSVKTFFDENIEEIRSSDGMYAIVGDEDKGTAFEVGYFIGLIGPYDLFNLNERILLIDDINGKFSKVCQDCINIAVSILNSGIRTYVMDISNKDIEDYVLMGILYGLGIEVVTWSNKILSSNLMTACSTSLHYQYPEDGELTKNQLQCLHIESESAFKHLFKDKRYNLSNMKFKSKIE